MSLAFIILMHAVDELNRFMNRENVPQKMRRRLREYFHQSKHLRLAQTQKGLIEDMSPMLSREVSWGINESWLSRIWFLREAPRSFMIDLASRMQARVFSPGEAPAIGFMYIVHRGIAMHNAKLITKGNVWGEDIILSSKVLRSKAQARAMNFLEVYYTTRSVLMYLARVYPKTGRKIRREAVLLALRREIIRTAKSKLGVGQDDLIAKAVRAKQLMNNLPGGTGGDSFANLMEQMELAKHVDWKQDREIAEEQRRSMNEHENEEEPIVEEEMLLNLDSGSLPGGRSSPVGRVSPVIEVKVKAQLPEESSPMGFSTGGGWMGDSQTSKEQTAMLHRLMDSQASMKKEMAQQRADIQSMLASMRSLQSWIINDKLAIAKLQA